MFDKLDYKQAAARLGISVGALRNKVSAGEVIFFKEGKRVFFEPSMIDALLDKKNLIRFSVALSSGEIESLESCLAKLNDFVNACEDSFYEMDTKREMVALEKVIDSAKKASA